MITGALIAGRADANWMTRVAAVLAKRISSAAGVALASEMACRRLPGPESAVVVTVNVRAREPSARTSRSAAATYMAMATRAAQKRALELTRVALRAPSVDA